LLLIDTTVNGDLKSPLGSTIDIAGSVVFNGDVSGAASFPGAGNATFNGSFSPGDSPFVSVFGGNFAVGSSGSLLIELGGTAPGTGYDQVNVNGQFTRDGTLNVVLIDGFTPTEGMSFDILNWGTVTGDFDNVYLPTLPSGLSWNTAQLASTGVISVVPEPGVVGIMAIAAIGMLRRRRRAA
jgi:hypothetical protein